MVESSPSDEEIGILQRALEDQGPMDRRELARRVGASYWGPGPVHGALQQACAMAMSPASRLRFGPAGDTRPRDEEHATAGRSSLPTSVRTRYRG